MQNQWDKNNTYVLVILGDQADKCVLSCRADKIRNEESVVTQQLISKKSLDKKSIDVKELNSKTFYNGNKFNKKIPNTKKYLQYYLTSHGILISKLATEILGIPKKNVKVFAYGSKDDFEVCKLTKNKSIIQLDFEPLQFFITKASVDDLGFEYFKTSDQLQKKLFNCFSNHPNPQIIVFLDNHGTTSSFGSLSLLSIYQMLMSVMPKSLRLFNDSCQSQCMIDVIEYYNDFKDRVSCIEDLDIYSVLSIFKLALQTREISDDRMMSSAKEIINYFYNLFRNCEDKYLFKETIRISSEFNSSFSNYFSYRNPGISSNSSIDSFIELILKKYGKNICIGIDEEASYRSLKVNLPKISVRTYGDYKKLALLYNSYRSQVKEDDKAITFRSITNTFNETIFSDAEIILKVKDISLLKLTNQIEIIIDQNLVRLESALKRGSSCSDVKIFTSAPRGGNGITFPSIRVSEDTKIVAGSPAMGAFIKEVFMHFVPDEINDKPMIKAVFGDEHEHIEFPTPWVPNANQRISMMWVWLDINKLYSEKTSNERLFTEEQIKMNPTVKAILEKIGYEEYEISERDAERIRFRRNSAPVKYQDNGSLLESPVYQIEESDEYYDSEDEYISGMVDHVPGEILSSRSEAEEEKIHVPINQNKIKKLQKMFPLTGMWEHDVVSVWKHLFTKRVFKYYEFDFEKELSKDARPGLHNFHRSYMRINRYFSASSLGWEYDSLGPQIDGLLNQCESCDLIEKILDLIAYCFDDADRVVTPLYYPSKRTIIHR